MKGIVLTLFISLLSLVGCKGSNQSGFTYWEDISKTEQESILQSPTICKNAVQYYQGSFKVSDNKLTDDFLNKITSGKNTRQETLFYFYIFNQICLNADGVVSDILGEYCMKVMLSNPPFLLSYFQRNVKLEKKYAELVGYELYFKEDGTSDIEYNYKDFKQVIETKIKNDQQYKKILLQFYRDVEVVMKNMN